MTTANAYPTSQTIRTIGILGGGQLGMMLAEAALPLGYQCVFLEDNAACPASLYGTVYHSEQLEDFIAEYEQSREPLRQRCSDTAIELLSADRFVPRLESLYTTLSV